MFSGFGVETNIRFFNRTSERNVKHAVQQILLRHVSSTNPLHSFARTESPKIKLNVNNFIMKNSII
jgi:hypothetical protein